MATMFVETFNSVAPSSHINKHTPLHSSSFSFFCFLFFFLLFLSLLLSLMYKFSQHALVRKTCLQHSERYPLQLLQRVSAAHDSPRGVHTPNKGSSSHLVYIHHTWYFLTHIYICGDVSLCSLCKGLANRVLEEKSSASSLLFLLLLLFLLSLFCWLSRRWTNKERWTEVTFSLSLSLSMQHLLFAAAAAAFSSRAALLAAEVAAHGDATVSLPLLLLFHHHLPHVRFALI